MPQYFLGIDHANGNGDYSAAALLTLRPDGTLELLNIQHSKYIPGTTSKSEREKWLRIATYRARRFIRVRLHHKNSTKKYSLKIYQ